MTEFGTAQLSECGGLPPLFVCGPALAGRALPESSSGANPIIDAWRAYAWVGAGETAKAAAAADRLRNLGDRMNPYYLAYPLIALGRNAEALTALEKALDDRVEQLVWLQVDPVLDPLRREPRFQRIVAAAGFR